MRASNVGALDCALLWIRCANLGGLRCTQPIEAVGDGLTREEVDLSDTRGGSDHHEVLGVHPLDQIFDVLVAVRPVVGEQALGTEYEGRLLAREP